MVIYLRRTKAELTYTHAQRHFPMLRPTLRATSLLRTTSTTTVSSSPAATRLFLFRAMKTLTEAIKEDHDEMYRYYTMYEKAHNEGDADAAGRWAHQLRWEVARHAAGEEIVVYPLMEKHMGAEGLRLADEDRAQHFEVKKLLNEAESLAPGSADLKRVMGAVIDHLKPHNESEENNDLPTLEKVLGVENSREAAQSFSRTKKFVPTHAHPALPDKPPYETLAGFLLTPIDVLKDWLSTWPTQEMKDESKKVWKEGGEREQVGL